MNHNKDTVIQYFFFLTIFSLFRFYYNKFAAYCQSKAAQVMFTEFLHEQLACNNKPVKVYAVHPGVIKTNMWSKYWFTHFTSHSTGILGKVRQTIKLALHDFSEIIFSFVD